MKSILICTHNKESYRALEDLLITKYSGEIQIFYGSVNDAELHKPDLTLIELQDKSEIKDIEYSRPYIIVLNTMNCCIIANAYKKKALDMICMPIREDAAIQKINRYLNYIDEMLLAN